MTVKNLFKAETDDSTDKDCIMYGINCTTQGTRFANFTLKLKNGFVESSQ